MSRTGVFMRCSSSKHPEELGYMVPDDGDEPVHYVKYSSLHASTRTSKVAIDALKDNTQVEYDVVTDRSGGQTIRSVKA